MPNAKSDRLLKWNRYITTNVHHHHRRDDDDDSRHRHGDDGRRRHGGGRRRHGDDGLHHDDRYHGQSHGHHVYRQDIDAAGHSLQPACLSWEPQK